jgi:hypothetical protein
MSKDGHKETAASADQEHVGYVDQDFRKTLRDKVVYLEDPPKSGLPIECCYHTENKDKALRHWRKRATRCIALFFPRSAGLEETVLRRLAGLGIFLPTCAAGRR